MLDRAKNQVNDNIIFINVIEAGIFLEEANNYLKNDFDNKDRLQFFFHDTDVFLTMYT